MAPAVTSRTGTRWPDPLPPEPSVGVWAPSSPAAAVYPQRFGRGVEALAASGFKVIVAESALQTGDVAPLPPQALAQELLELLESCDAVVAAVGGWTCIRLLQHLDYDTIGAASKPIVGYSDLTTILTVVTERSRLVTFHGPMVLSEWGEYAGPWQYTRKSFLDVLRLEQEARYREATSWTDELLWWDRDDDRPRSPAGSHREQLRVLRPGTATGAIWGGNINALCLLAGTPFWAQPPTDAIVALEGEALSPEEYAARLEQLRLIGVFQNASGIMIGKMSQPKDAVSGFSDFDSLTLEVIRTDVPVAAGLDIGHTEPMWTLPIGAQAELTCRREIQLIVRRPGGTCDPSSQ